VTVSGLERDALARVEETRERGGLADATCVVTGGSRGIGRAIATELGAAGADVVVNYRSSADRANAVAEAIDDAAEGEATAVRADVADPEAVESMATAVRERFGPVDVLVNNAGITVDTPFERMDRSDWQRVIETNLGGTFNCANAFYEDIRDADAGRLINVGSVVGRRGNYGQTNYAASKSGLIGFTRSLALELAPHGSTVNCVAPGFTETEMLEVVREDVQEAIRADIPLDRFAAPEEVAAAVGFLAAPRASYVTGEIVNVNGGMYA